MARKTQMTPIELRDALRRTVAVQVENLHVPNVFRYDEEAREAWSVDDEGFEQRHTGAISVWPVTEE